MDVDENVESKLRVAVAVVGVKVPLKCFQRIHKTVKKGEGRKVGELHYRQTNRK